MIISGGALALAGVFLLVNMNWQLNLPPTALAEPQAPVVHQLHDGMVEVDWNDVPGADRYELQMWHPTGWIDLPDSEFGIEVDFYGSRAVVSKRTAGALINTFRVKALGCGRSSDWSAYGRKASAESIEPQAEPYELIDPITIDQHPTVIWSGMLTVGTVGNGPGDSGYSRTSRVGLLSPDAFMLEQRRTRIVQALQASDGFYLELQHAGRISSDFTLTIHDGETLAVTQLSTCDSLRMSTENGDSFLWLDADVQWEAGAHTGLNISLTNNSASLQGERTLRSLRPLTASLERVPAHHSGDDFALFVRFSKPVSVDADSLLTNSFVIGGGAVISSEPLDGRLDLWKVKIAPDSRRSVRVRLRSATTCASPGAICTLHSLRLSNQPEAIILGPPILGEFIPARDFHSGARQVPVRIQLSEPLLTSSRALRQMALNASGGLLSGLRRVDGRSDLWEFIVDPQSTATVQLKLNPISACGATGIGCLDDLYRIAKPLDLSLPPAIIHLTFDDGPNPVYTPRILDILSWYDAKATFFVTGEGATTYPDLIERIVNEGHTLANHTWDHVALDTLSAEEFNDTVLRTQHVLGEHATACIRPPYYRADSETYRRAARLGLNVIMGNVRPRDWTRPGAMVIADRIVGGAEHRAVVVLHDGGGDRSQTVEGLRAAMAHLHTQNYSFEPVCS
jgi:peptidoglycan/xylan/chitin deacetylase (PgdA/CDA1 family)